MRNIEQDVLRTRTDVSAATKTSVQMMIRVLFILARELAREDFERSSAANQRQQQQQQLRSNSAESFVTTTNRSSEKTTNSKSSSTSSFNSNSNSSSPSIVQYYQQGMSEMLCVLWYVLDSESIDQSRSPTHDGFVDALSQAHIESDCFHLVKKSIILNMIKVLKIHLLLSFGNY